MGIEIYIKIVSSLISKLTYKMICFRSLEKVQVLSNGSTSDGQEVALFHNAIIRKRNQFTEDLLASCITVLPKSEVEPGHVVRIILVSQNLKSANFISPDANTIENPK